jgi:metal-responsive CopG/Arc/MetJ family transcriptional regulator
MSKECIRATVDIPIELAEKIKDALDQQIAPSRNALFAQALQDYLEGLEAKQIDEQIAQMADDEEYKDLHLQMAREYEPAGWETLRLSEENS